MQNRSEPPEDYAVFTTGKDGWWYAVWIERWGYGTPWRVHELTIDNAPPGEWLRYVATHYSREQAIAACWVNREQAVPSAGEGKVE